METHLNAIARSGMDQSLNTFSRSVMYGGNLPGNEFFHSILYKEYLKALMIARDPPADDLEDLGSMAFDDAVETLWRNGWKAYAVLNEFQYIRFSNPNDLCSCAA
jgi:hypothetical protein